MASAIWDNVVASATKAATSAGEATQVAAAKAKLHADLLVIDRDIHARKEKFGVDMYAHLESITSTQEFYVADDRLINVIRPTLIKAQREVAAYERKRDAMRGRADAAQANRSGTAPIFTASTIGEKIMNAAKYAAAGAKEAATKTELAMLERQILGFKEEFGVELYPIFESMEDNEGWLPTDRKVRSLYDGAREDINAMQKAKGEKREQIKRLDGVEGSGLTPPTVPPVVVATPVHEAPGAMPWASTEPASTAAKSVTNGYGSTQPQAAHAMAAQHQPAPRGDGGFGFVSNNDAAAQSMNQSMPSYFGNPAQTQHSGPLSATQQPPQQAMGAVFDPFDGISGSAPPGGGANASSFGAYPYNAGGAGGHQHHPNGATEAQSSGNAFDPFSGAPVTVQSSNSGSQALSDADLNLFKY